MKKLLLNILFWGISATNVYASENITSKKLKDTEIQLGSAVYTISEIRSHLDLILDKEDGKDVIYRFGKEEDKKEIGYYLYENGYTQILETFDLYLSEIAKLTNLEFYKQEQHELRPNITWLYLNSPIELYEVPNIKNLYRGIFWIKVRKELDMYKMVYINSKKLKNSATSYATSIGLALDNKTGTLDRDYISDYFNIRYILKSDVKNIDKFANETVLKDMIGAFILHTPKEGEIKETLTNVNANPLAPPNMYTFDKALLKAIYSDGFIFGTPREEALDWLSAEIFQLIKSGEIK